MADVNLETITAVKVVDARGSACPGPLLEAKKAIGTVAVGETIELWSGDPSTKGDLPRWAEKVGHEFLGAITADGYDRMFITRGK
jgi:TusA-related sulfurtransferase